MNRQITDTIMMIRPVAFRRNEETAANNYYQQSIKGLNSDELQDNAEMEFDGFAKKLTEAGVNVLVYRDNREPSTPDSIFPNNWVSFHEDGSVMLFPMFAENRRTERRMDLLEELGKNYKIDQVDSMADWESKNKFLEATGSLIMDRTNGICYAAISDRTHPEVVDDFVQRKNFRAIKFHANQTVNNERLPIYHTNVMMCVGEKFALICADSIDNESEKKQVLESLESTGKEIITINETQNNCFAGNMLQVMNRDGKRLIVMSDSAYWSLEPAQINALERHGEIIHSGLDTIETLGGGSARCMMAEVFLPRN